MIKTADIIVIGGGMAGISAAASLSDLAHVVVLEAEREIGYHSTSRSAAMFIRNYGSGVLRNLNAHGFQLFQQIEQELQQPLLKTRGELIVAGEDENEQFDVYLNDCKDIEEIELNQAIHYCPALRKDKIHRAAIEHDACDIDVDLLLQYFARKLKANSSEINLRSKVNELFYKGNCWHIHTDKDEYQSPIVVNAAGAWADAIATMAGIDPLGLTPMRRSVALIKVLGYENVNNWPLVLNVTESWYAKPQSGLLIVSPADEILVEPHDAWPEDIVLAEGLHRCEQFMDIRVDRIEHSWAGLRTFAKDRNPVVGLSNQADGFYWLAGQGGYGIQTAPILANLSLDLILNKKSKLPGNLVDALSPVRKFD